MKFGSVCSGIEAASVAWHPLGWKAAWLAEIEPFPSAVLAHHYPDVPNLGDMTKLPERIASGEIEAPDVLCGGTPCQAFSVAGLRKSLDDARGNLSLTFCEIANAIDTIRAARREQPAIIFWENVPGVLSTKDNAFGCFLAGLAGEELPLLPPGGKWTNAGCVFGPKRAVAWRVLDAQYFGVAQRRRRVFVVASARDGFDPAAVLFEFDGVRRDTAPSREKGQGVAKVAGERAASSSTFACAGIGAYTNSSASATLLKSGQDLGPGCEAIICTEGAAEKTPAQIAVRMVAFGEYPDDGTASAMKARDYKDAADLVVQPVPARLRYSCACGECFNDQHADGAQTLAPAECPKCGSENDIVDNSVMQPAFGIPGNWIGRKPENGGNAVEPMYDIAPCLTKADQHGVCAPVAFSFDSLASNSMKSKNPISGCRPVELSKTIDTPMQDPACNQGGIGVMTPAMQVRRLTPTECERLQGFPTVSEKLTIEACLDHQNQSVRVALKCLKWQNSAWPADVSELNRPAKIADAHSNTSQACQEPLAAMHVRMHSVDELLEIHSAGKLIWSANGAGHLKKCLPPTLTENSVQELARLHREVAHLVRSGKAASPRSIRLSFPASSGATNAAKSGRATAESVNDATSAPNSGTFTTSDLGQITTCSGLTAEILCCSALRAIAGCIPETTLPETFSIELTVETPYTAIAWRNKPASECPDGPRYRALGNSWAVPVVRWIGQRIDSALSYGQTQPSHVEAAQTRSTPESDDCAEYLEDAA